MSNGNEKREKFKKKETGQYWDEQGKNIRRNTSRLEVLD